MATIKNPIIVTKKTTGGDAEYIKFIERSSTEITVPEGATEIGVYSFYKYNDSTLGSGKGLKNVILPNSVTQIGTYAFDTDTQLKNIIMPNVSNIGSYAFFSCSNLELSALPSSLTFIGGSAFSSCTSLALTSLPENLTAIGGSAFNGCTSLALTSLPENLNSMGEYAFSNCSSLNIHNSPFAPRYCFKNCVGITGKISVAKVGSNCDFNLNCFEGCTGITEVEYLGSCRNYSLSRTYELWSNAFLNCSSLTKMSFPNATYVMTLRNVNAFPNGADWAGTIEVPSALLETWKASTNWSSLTNVTWIGI